MTGARSRPLTVLLALEAALAAVLVALRLPSLISSIWVQDDAYVSFRYARNLVRGNGLVYNVGAYVEGYTNFLWTLISALPLMMGGEDPLAFMHLVGLVLWAGCYLILLRASWEFFGEGLWIAPLAVLPLAYHWSFNMWFFSGMETPLVCFLTIAAVYYFARDPEQYGLTLLWASLAGVALTMTRPDGVVTLAGLAAAGVLCYGRRVFVERKWRIYVLAPLLPILLVYLPFNLWRIWYYGSFYPNTYYAKVAYLSFYSRGWAYLQTFLQIYGLAPWLPLLPLGALLCRPGMARRFLCATTFVAAGVLFYVVRLGGDFMEWRFLTPIMGIVYPGLVWGAAAIFARLLDRARVGAIGGWIGGLVVTLLLVVVTRAAPANRMEWYPPGQETIGLLRRYCDPGRYDWRSAGKVFDQVLPRDVTIATTSAGMIPFFCDRPCLDLHGLTDPQIAHEMLTPESRGRVGHEHWLQDHGVMKQRGVDVILDWADPHAYPTSILEPPTERGEKVSVRLPDGRYVDVILLRPEKFAQLREAKDPRVVFYGSVKVADPREIQVVGDKLAGQRVIDRVDLQEPESEKAHEFLEVLDGVHGGSWHKKFLTYMDPNASIQLEDQGRRLPYGASWTIDNVRADRPLVFVARFDHTLGGEYDVEVNGKPIAARLLAPGGGVGERWDEAVVEVPADVLVNGRNRFRLTKRSEPAGDAELYYFWFLQPE